tara:strand:- start:14397 stop:14597 length:201 start_codon:yes stop_codon:yes gene_type:complete
MKKNIYQELYYEETEKNYERCKAIGVILAKVSCLKQDIKYVDSIYTKEELIEKIDKIYKLINKIEL